MLVAGQRVRVVWSGKVGRVITPRMPREPGQETEMGVLVLLDPFVARWRSPTPVTIIGLEVIYSPQDLIVEPPR
jgi:hypothetical protein